MTNLNSPRSATGKKVVLACLSPLLYVGVFAGALSSGFASELSQKSSNMQSAGQTQSAAVELNAKLADMNSWSGSFEQTVLDDKAKVLQKLQGELAIQKPLAFSWRTLEPFPQEIVSNGTQLWIHDQDLEQVIIRDINQELAPMPVALLSGQLDVLDEHYEVSAPGQKAVIRGLGTRVFKLVPKNEDAAGDFSSLKITFRQEKLLSLELKDTLGQTTLLKFSNQQLNPSFSKSHFEFEVPDDADVIDERASAVSER